MSLFTNRRSDGQSPAQVAGAEYDLAEWDDPEEAQAIDVPPRPKRRLDDEHRVQAGNVEIDVAGLLHMLDIDDPDDLAAISDAWQRFLADHQPLDTDDPDAAELKERIRRELNTAYASFRLTRAG